MKKIILYLTMLALVIASVVAWVMIERKSPTVERDERLMYKKGSAQVSGTTKNTEHKKAQTVNVGQH